MLPLLLGGTNQVTGTVLTVFPLRFLLFSWFLLLSHQRLFPTWQRHHAPGASPGPQLDLTQTCPTKLCSWGRVDPDMNRGCGWTSIGSNEGSLSLFPTMGGKVSCMLLKSVEVRWECKALKNRRINRGGRLPARRKWMLKDRRAKPNMSGRTPSVCGHTTVPLPLQASGLESLQMVLFLSVVFIYFCTFASLVLCRPSASNMNVASCHFPTADLLHDWYPHGVPRLDSDAVPFPLHYVPSLGSFSRPALQFLL